MGQTKKPLEGRRVVITRAVEQAREFIQQLEALGAQTLLLPAVSFSDPADMAPLDQRLHQIKQFDWIFFTSQNAVRFFARRARTIGLACDRLQSPRPMVAAVGPATAQAARDEGFRVDHVAAQHSGPGLAHELWASVTGRRILLPRSDRAGGDLPAALREAGAEVTEVMAYRTVAGPPADGSALEAIGRGEVDVVTFASPSAFHHFSEQAGTDMLKDVNKKVVFAAIGPTTAQAIREAGFEAAIEAKEATSVGLAAAIADYFEGVKSS